MPGGKAGQVVGLTHIVSILLRTLQVAPTAVPTYLPFKCFGHLGLARGKRQPTACFPSPVAASTSLWSCCTFLFSHHLLPGRAFDSILALSLLCGGILSPNTSHKALVDLQLKAALTLAFLVWQLASVPK